MTLEVEMAVSERLENIAHYRKLIAQGDLNSARVEQRHAMLLKLLAAELAKDKPPPTCSKGY
jgi:hypothetical protein